MFHRHLLTFTLSGVTLLLGACAPMHESASPPQAISSLTHGVDDQSIWPDQAWWLAFNDPQLNQLIQIVLTQSLDLIDAQLRIDHAWALAGDARSNTLPSVDVGGQMTRERFSQNDMAPPPWAGNWTSSSSIRLNGSHALDFWGKHRSILKSRLTDVQVAELQAKQTELVLSSQVASMYFQLQGLWSMLDLINQGLDQRHTIYLMTQQRFSEGLDTLVEVRQAQSEYESTQVERLQITEQIELKKHQLARLLGLEPADLPELKPASMTLGDQIVKVPTDIPLHLLVHRADVQAARLSIEAESQRVDAAKAAFYPDINLNVFAGFSVTGVSDLINAGNRILGIQPAITLPVFNAGQLQSALDQQQTQSNLAINAYNQIVLRSVNEVADTLSSFSVLDESLKRRGAARQHIEEAYVIAKQRYEAGLGTYLSVLLAQQQVLLQQRLETDLQTRSVLLRVQLIQALGGGFHGASPSLN